MLELRRRVVMGREWKRSRTGRARTRRVIYRAGWVCAHRWSTMSACPEPGAWGGAAPRNAAAATQSSTPQRLGTTTEELSPAPREAPGSSASVSRCPAAGPRSAESAEAQNILNSQDAHSPLPAILNIVFLRFWGEDGREGRGGCGTRAGLAMSSPSRPLDAYAGCPVLLT